MKNPESLTDQKIINWLLEKDNPSVRYLTLKKLLNKPEKDMEVSEARKSIMTTGIVPEILGKMEEGGHWGKPDRFYTDKYKGTVWQLMVLAELFADGKDKRIRRVAKFILDNSRDPVESGYSFRRSEKSGGGLASGVIPCLTGNMVWSLVRLGFMDDERVRKGIEWICKYQRADDGTQNEPKGSPYDRYRMCWGRHSCHMGVVKSLKALAEIPENKRTTGVEAKIRELAGYLLVHRIYKKSHDIEKVSRPGWLRLGFPLMYQTDILEILEILVKLGYRDSRMDEAIDVLRSKKTIEGRWRLENTFNGRMLKNIEKKGADSKWITLKAMIVLAAYN